MLINLLFNAIKYNRTDGTVIVECSPAPSGEVRISVRDTGQGLSREQLDQLFQPFNRLGKEAGSEEGTGIGLVVTKRLVELMGGRIGVESVVGEGSVFWAELALAQAPRFAALESRDSPAVDGRAASGSDLRTVLYVEDNPANLELVEQLIARRPDLRLLSAADGKTGIEYARACIPDLILMDINLPGLSGIDVMAFLRADPLTAHIPIIALSANAVPRDIQKGLGCGVLQLHHQAHHGQQVHGSTRGRPPACSADHRCWKAQTMMDPGQSQHALALKEARILIVDDQPANISLLEETLQQAGYTNVTSTLHPKEVCALHWRNDYDLILLDLQMPGMDGFQVMEGLKMNKRDAYLPVLVITAQPAHKLQALQAGARDFISKPFDLVEVKTRVHNMLEVRLLYKRLENHNRELEEAVRERTAELRESEARYRRLTELASDWYWEQDEHGRFTKVSGPVLEMLGLPLDGFGDSDAGQGSGWNAAQRAALQTRIEARETFLDFVFSRVNPDGSEQIFQVSGEPMFGPACRFLGYRGIGIEITQRK